MKGDNMINMTLNSHSFDFQNFKNSRENNFNRKMVLATVMKSGTNLLKKILFQLGIEYRFKQNQHHLLCRYFEYQSGNSLDKIMEKKNKYYVLYRDPRDCLISQINWKMKPHFKKKIKNWSDFPKYTMSQLISKSLNCENIHPYRIGGYAQRLFRSLNFALLLKKRALKNCLLIRFEDLVPTFSGGADHERRFRVFKKICEFSGKDIPDEKILEVMESCWGGTGTFRKEEIKKVGQWKKYFQPRHIKRFHKEHNRLLLGLGYETDRNWHLKYLRSEDENVIKST